MNDITAIATDDLWELEDQINYLKDRLAIEVVLTDPTTPSLGVHEFLYSPSGDYHACRRSACGASRSNPIHLVP